MSKVNFNHDHIKFGKVDFNDYRIYLQKEIIKIDFNITDKNHNKRE